MQIGNLSWINKAETNYNTTLKERMNVIYFILIKFYKMF